MRVWVATVVRLVLAAVWAWVAVARIGDPAASVDAVRAYQLLPDPLERGIGYGLPFVALALAVLLLVGLAVRVAAAVSAVLFLLQLGRAGRGRGARAADRVWLSRLRRRAADRPVHLVPAGHRGRRRPARAGRRAGVVAADPVRAG